MKFSVTCEVTADIEIDKVVLYQVDDGWKSCFYDIESDEDVIKMIAYNLIQGRKLSQLDGFANLSDDLAKIKNVDYEIVDVKE